MVCWVCLWVCGKGGKEAENEETVVMVMVMRGCEDVCAFCVRVPLKGHAFMGA